MSDPQIMCPKCHKLTDMFTRNGTYLCRQCNKDYHICCDHSGSIKEGDWMTCSCNNKPIQPPKDEENIFDEYQRKYTQKNLFIKTRN
jgi:hypothetical protein